MAKRVKIGVLLSGSGVYDGSEIHEAVLTLLAIDQMAADAVCMAPNIPQHHVVNHLTGKEQNVERNVLEESARIARGNIKALEDVQVDDIDALIVLGGFGAAKNLTKWAFAGQKGAINEHVKELINKCFDKKKPIGAMCMGPTVVAKALEHRNANEKLTVGTQTSPSPYDILDISNSMNSIGADAQMAEVYEIVVDYTHKIVSTPCYMMETSIALVNEGIQKLVKKVIELA